MSNKTGETKLPFGKYKGLTIDNIAESDDGLLYLDWLRGQSFLRNDFRANLEAYLDDPVIKRELSKII